jgi:hypothetical protein
MKEKESMEVNIRWATTTRGTFMVAKITMADDRPRAAPMGAPVSSMVRKKKRRARECIRHAASLLSDEIEKFFKGHEQHAAASQGNCVVHVGHGDFHCRRCLPDCELYHADALPDHDYKECHAAHATHDLQAAEPFSREPFDEESHDHVSSLPRDHGKRKKCHPDKKVPGQLFRVACGVAEEIPGNHLQEYDDEHKADACHGKEGKGFFHESEDFFHSAASVLAKKRKRERYGTAPFRQAISR